MGGLRTDMGRVQADVKGLSGILSRIEQGVLRAQEQQDAKEERSRHSPVAIATVLVTVMSMMVGGAWVIGGNVARMDERSMWLEHQQQLTDQRVWVIMHGGTNGQPSQTGK